jgi:hypothetical protein
MTLVMSGSLRIGIDQINKVRFWMNLSYYKSHGQGSKLRLQEPPTTRIGPSLFHLRPASNLIISGNISPAVASIDGIGLDMARISGG